MLTPKDENTGNDLQDSRKLDELLVEQALAGDSSAFEEIVRLYKRRITALGMGFFKNLSDTEDFVQEVFIKLYTRLSSFRGEARFSTWCTRIAYNIAFNSIHRRKEYESIAEEQLLRAPGRGPEEEQMRRITAEAVREVVRELPPVYAICLDLYFFHDMPYKEISIITDLPVNTIKSHIFRAKKLLRDKLIDFYGV
jgi:RNA polymerase sigma-70 factor (ECF subfamily)